MRNVHWHEGLVSRSDRDGVTGRGLTIWLTGLSGSGKSTVASELEHLLLQAGRIPYRLDADNLRHGLNADLGFSSADRQENVRRVAEVARLFADAGLVALVPIISPYREGRAAARRLHEDVGLMFIEVFMDTPLEVCEARDPKGLYRRARAGEIEGMTGIDSSYERPRAPDIRLTPEVGDARTMARIILTESKTLP